MSNFQNQIFQYNGSPISFQKGDSVTINATEMAKPFGKFTKDWLRTKRRAWHLLKEGKVVVL